MKKSVAQILTNKDGGRYFSFEVLPPLKGNGTDALFRTIEKLRAFEPQYINITTHHSEYVYNELPNGQFQRQRIRRRPGTVAMAAAIQQRFGLPVIPHVICSGVTAEDIEYELIDLQFLGIENILLLRGDKAAEDKSFIPTAGGHAHTTDLIRQVQRFNEGFFNDGTPIKNPGARFSFGVACYPEKHEEAPNLDMDMKWLLEKQRLGAEYAVTQLFYDITMVPKTFHCDIPEELAQLVARVHTDEEARRLGVAWCVRQCRDLYDHGVNNIHFYTVSAVDAVCEIMEQLKND